jgi:hypothetical protein
MLRQERRRSGAEQWDFRSNYQHKRFGLKANMAQVELIWFWLDIAAVRQEPLL